MKQYDDQTEFDQKFQSFESIEFDEKDKKDVYANIMSSIEKKRRKNRSLKWTNHILTTAVVAIFFIVGGYLFTDKLIMEQAHPSPQDENTKTIQTYLENEFTGPSDELSNILDQGLHPPELEAYLEENYKPLVMDLENMVNYNHVLVYLRFAYGNGYQLQPTNIDIQKIDNIQNDAYNYEVKVEYSKDDQTNKATVTGRININDNGKISKIRIMDDDGLLEEVRN